MGFPTTIAAATIAVGTLALGHYRRTWRWRSQMSVLCRALPKAELHAHLHGCARLATIAELAPAGMDTRALLQATTNERDLSRCFAIFDIIHKTITTLSAVRRVTGEVLDDFEGDGVAYLELRTTPRALQDADAERYVRTVLGVIDGHECGSGALRDGRTVHGAGRRMCTRLILSIDRTGSIEQAMATVHIAITLRQEAIAAGAPARIVGIDFSGNPTKGTFATFIPAFAAARDAGLRIAVHTAEVDRPDDTSVILAFRPDRLGHALTLTPDHISSLEEHPIPIELCPTSNLKTLQLPSLRHHPTMLRWQRSSYPYSISTDDSTVRLRHRPVVHPLPPNSAHPSLSAQPASLSPATVDSGGRGAVFI